MTDIERLDETRNRMLRSHDISNADAEWLCDLARSALDTKPPAGSVKVRVMVCRIERDENWYGLSQVFDAMTPNPQPDRKATHAAIIEAWIPPVVVPVVEGRVQG